jgi:ParB/RepB/Spo0J family partition protein
MTGKLIRIDQVDIPLDYERKSSLIEDDALRRSIEAGGIQQPIIVFEKPNGRYALVDGFRRIEICKFLDVKTVPAVIDELPKDIAPEAYQDRLRFILDEHRQDLLPSQRSTLIKQLMSMFHMKQKDVASYLGVNAGSITNWLAVDNYAPEIVKAVDTGQINMHAARSFDGMKPEVQPRIFKSLRREFSTLAGGKLHKLIRTKFSPKSHPDFYLAPEKTAEKLARKTKNRAAKKRPRLTRSEKDLLSHDLTLKEVELADSKSELQTLNREITLATAPVRAIMRDEELVAMMPPETRIELERFAEIYV